MRGWVPASALIPDLAKHLIDSGGKRLRPMLTLAAAQLGGYTGDKHINLAAAVEFIHTATLLHDDVVDASTLRRGKDAANLVWGNKADGPSRRLPQFSCAFEMMVDTDSLRVPQILCWRFRHHRRRRSVMQLKSESNPGTTEEHYLKVVGAKTAALFAAAAESGATLCDKGPAYIEAMRAYGESLGIAFQLVDDALDYSGRQALMGKAVGDDFREAKVTLPVILAYARADKQAQVFWKRVIETSSQTEADLERAISYVESTGAIQETMTRARHYADASVAALAPLPQGEIRSALSDIADFCVERAFLTSQLSSPRTRDSSRRASARR